MKPPEFHCTVSLGSSLHTDFFHHQIANYFLWSTICLHRYPDFWPRGNHDVSPCRYLNVSPWRLLFVVPNRCHLLTAAVLDLMLNMYTQIFRCITLWYSLCCSRCVIFFLLPDALRGHADIPLHRFMGFFVSQLCKLVGTDILLSIFPSRNFVLSLMEHPLRIQV